MPLSRTNPMKLSKEKRDQLILACMSVVISLVLIFYFWINPRYAAIKRTNTDIKNQQGNFQEMQDTIAKAAAAADQLHEATNALAKAEGDLAFGDPNAWIYETIRHFKTRYKIDVIPGTQASVEEVDLLPNFPYKQLRFVVSGSAYYHDLGHFVSDFENDF